MVKRPLRAYLHTTGYTISQEATKGLLLPTLPAVTQQILAWKITNEEEPDTRTGLPLQERLFR